MKSKKMIELKERQKGKNPVEEMQESSSGEDRNARIQ